MPELLAPVGNMECLKAAINAGCDAVYLSGRNFGARSFAGNFSNEELIEAIKICHLYGVKVYVTVNIVFHDKDLNNVSDKASLYTYLKTIFNNDSFYGNVVKIKHANNYISIYANLANNGVLFLTIYLAQAGNKIDNPSA